MPAWLTTTLAVLPFVGAGIGYTASQNTTDSMVRGYHSGVREPYNPKHDRG